MREGWKYGTDMMGGWRGIFGVGISYDGTAMTAERLGSPASLCSSKHSSSFVNPCTSYDDVVFHEFFVKGDIFMGEILQFFSGEEERVDFIPKAVREQILEIGDLKLSII